MSSASLFHPISDDAPSTEKGGNGKETPALAEQIRAQQRKGEKTRRLKAVPFNKKFKGTRADLHLLALFTLLTSAACLKLPPRLKRLLFELPRLSEVSEGDTIGSVIVLGDRVGLLSLEFARTEGCRLVLGRRTSLSR
jgi:hypothetical protein